MLAAIEREVRLLDRLVAFLNHGFLDEHIDEVVSYLRGEVPIHEMFSLLMRATRHSPHTVVMRRVRSPAHATLRREADPPSLLPLVYEEATWHCYGLYLRDDGSHPQPPSTQWREVT